MKNIPITKTFIAVLILLGLSLGMPAHGASTNLVQQPYLQQLTDSSVVILWLTATGSSAEVHYSTDTSYSNRVSGTVRSFPLGQMNRVQLTGLQPNTTYYYKIYTDAEDLFPEATLTLKTAPPPGSTSPFTFLAFGDYGNGSSSQKNLRDRMLNDSFDFIITTGDNVYSSGQYDQFQAYVFQIYQDIFRLVPIFPSPGNHDYYTSSAAPYLDWFDLPANAWRCSDRERYYSFDYGNAHFVMLDSNTPLNADDGAADNDMFDWLRDDLARTSQTWKIVAFHHAAYSTGWHGSTPAVQSKLVPIFEAYGVDLVLNGHDHIYQRSKPLRGGQVTSTDQGGIVYVVTGAGAAASYGCGSADWSAVAYCGQGYGIYNRIMISGNTLTLYAIDGTGSTRDTYTITKPPQPPASVSLDGPVAGLTGSPVGFLAAAAPVTATLPFTYTWQADGQSPITQTGGLQSGAAFTWTTPGTYAVTVTVRNSAGSIGRSVQVGIQPAAVKYYLPVIARNFDPSCG